MGVCVGVGVCKEWSKRVCVCEREGRRDRERNGRVNQCALRVNICIPTKQKINIPDEGS